LSAVANDLCVVVGSSGGPLPPSPPSEKATARQDQAGKAGTGDWSRYSYGYSFQVRGYPVVVPIANVLDRPDVCAGLPDGGRGGVGPVATQRVSLEEKGAARASQRECDGSGGTGCSRKSPSVAKRGSEIRKGKGGRL